MKEYCVLLKTERKRETNYTTIKRKKERGKKKEENKPQMEKGHMVESVSE